MSFVITEHGLLMVITIGEVIGMLVLEKHLLVDVETSMETTAQVELE